MSEPVRRATPILIIVSAAIVAWAIGRQRGTSTGPAAPARPSTPSVGDAGSLADAVSLTPREIIPATPPGEPVLIELTEAPATRYGAAEPTEADAVYAGLVADLGRGDVIYDAALGRAARELAFQHSMIGGLVPQDIVNFLLRSAGAVDRTVVQGYTATGGDDLSAVTTRLKSLIGPRTTGALARVGIGEAYIPGAKRPRYIALLLSRRQIEVSPAPRTAQLGSRWQLTGTLPRGWREPSALALYPDGQLESVEAHVSGRRFTVNVDTGDTSGVLDVSLTAVGPFGPSPLIQLPVVVGDELPRTYRGHAAPDESDIATPAKAEALAFELLNHDRKRFGLEPLARDARLDTIARAHSVDMRDHTFFGHYSEATGTPGDRLTVAGYKVAMHGENVAKGGSIQGAEEGLMHSLSHRANILQTRFTHVGIGVAGKRDGDQIQWYLTQLFAKPVADLDPGAAGRRLVERLNDARDDADLDAFTQVGRLDRICDLEVESVAGGHTDGVAERILGDAKRAGLTRNGAYVWVSATTDLEALRLPEQALNESFTDLGVAVAQLPEHPNGLIGVVILFTGGL